MQRFWSYMMLLMTINCYAVDLPKGIDWHKGSVENALELAKKNNRPLYLYWGAVWCPPCNQIKETIFKSSLFQKSIKSFIPVYLDGDNTASQFWGEKLKTSGYPTMLILSSQGSELARLPTGVPVEEYVALMEFSLEQLSSISDVIQLALEKKAGVNEWKRLAGHSWPQDSDINIKQENLKGTFFKLWQNSLEQSPEIQSRLYLQHLLTLKDQNNSKVILKEKLGVFKAIVSDLHLYRTNRELLNGSFDDINLIFKELSDEKEVAWNETLLIWKENSLKLLEDKNLSLDDRLSCLVPNVKMKTIDNEFILKKALWADKQAVTDYERQAVMSTVIYVLKSANLLKQAKDLALAEIKRSKSPYYFMSILSGIEKSAGDYAASKKWATLAWESSRGSNTRFQWGVALINFLLEEEKVNQDELFKNLELVLSEILKSEEAFNGRNAGRFKTLAKKINDWLEKNKMPQEVVLKKKMLKLKLENLSKHAGYQKWLEGIINI